MKTFALSNSSRVTAAAQPAAIKSFWVRESPGKAVDVPEVPALNLLPPDMVPDRVLRKIGRQYEHLVSSPNDAFSAPVASMDHYIRFGEECASRNLVPSLRLFHLWMEADRIGEV